MTIPNAIDLIKQGLSSHPNLNWESRAILVQAVSLIESALSDKANPSPSQPAAVDPTAQSGSS